MTDWDNIWRKQDEARAVINAVVGESIWNIGYSQDREAIEVDLTKHLDEEDVSELSCQFTLPTDYDGEGSHGTKFVLYTRVRDNVSMQTVLTALIFQHKQAESQVYCQKSNRLLGQNIGS